MTQLDAPEATVDALMFELRDRGFAALGDRPNQRRLAELAPSQVNDVIKRLHRLRRKYPAITDDLLLFIGRCHNEF
jgi:hypothetical protein